MTKKTPHQFNIAVLLPTRGRTDALSRSLFSLLDLAKDLTRIQFIIGIDNDDTIGLTHFTDVIQPKFDDAGVEYTAIGFERLGYAGLNKYFNTLAESADADWLFVWCDDAIMETQDWDEHIAECTGEFKLLKVHTHNEHPYSIFPIVPAEWREITGYISKHQLIDCEVSQMAYLMDLMKIIEVNVTHDRADLTGNNNDANASAKQYFEGNPSNPYDFHYPTFQQQRSQDMEKIVKYMRDNNLDLTWWDQVKAGEVNPWQKMENNDPNGQTARFNFKKTIDGRVQMVREDK
jgi:hypothetical protein